MFDTAKKGEVKMKNNKLTSILYIIATLTFLIPILIVFVTGNGFNSFHSKIHIGISLTFVIVGRILTVLKKTTEDKRVQWGGMGIIAGMFIALVELFLK